MANLIAAILFGMTGELDGDLIGYPLPSYSILLTATIFVVSSIRVSTLFPCEQSSGVFNETNIIGIFVLLAQVGYLIFNFQEGVNVAGSIQQSDSSLRYLWFILVPDALFLVYYGLCRKSHLFVPNLFLYLISNAMRGWLGTWLIVFFIEGAYRLREGHLNWKKVLPILAIFVAALPILVELKWKIRTSLVDGNVPLNEVYGDILEYVKNIDWLEDFSNVIRPVVMRFQHLACVIGIMDNANVISDGLSDRVYLYFFEEGLQPLEKLVGMAATPDIHVTLLRYLIPDQLQPNSITNTHVGFVGWFWLSPLLLPFYLLYLLLLSWLGVWLGKKLETEGLFSDVVWFSWLGFLMNGWFAAYIQFLQAMVVMICAMYLFRNAASLFDFNEPSKENEGKECKQLQ
jgi:hypothetical protein